MGNTAGVVIRQMTQSWETLYICGKSTMQLVGLSLHTLLKKTTWEKKENVNRENRNYTPNSRGFDSM